MANFLGQLSDFLSGGNQSAAEEAAAKATAQFQGLQTPDIDQEKLQLQKMVDQGQISPQQAQVFMQKRSEANNVTTNPNLDAAQMGALTSLQDIGKGGMTNMDRAQLAQIQSQEDTAARGSRDAIINNAQSRGVGGSGVDLAARLSSDQAHASDQSARDTEVAGQAQQRALQALQSAGQLGGQIKDQQFAQGMAKANANDAINQFNTNNMNQNSLYNTQTANTAQAANTAERQRISDANTNIGNQQQQYNSQLPQQNFENEYKKAGGVAGAYGNEADQYQKAGQATTNLVGSGIQAGGLYGASNPFKQKDPYGTTSDKNAKKDIKKWDAGDFLDSLTSTKYKYKDPMKHGKGDQIGVMADDMEKHAPQLVSKGDDGLKQIDYGKSGGVMFASLKTLHDRLKKLEKGK